MEASFYIWLARNSYGWFINTYLIIIEDANFPAVGSKNTNRSRGNPSSNTSSLNLQPLRNRRKCDRRTKHPGFFNKGNTCYANSVLQGLSQSHHSVVSQLLSHVSYHPWPEQWLWSVTFKKILPTFCRHFVGNSQPVSISFPSLTPKKMSSTLLHMFSSM